MRDNWNLASPAPRPSRHVSSRASALRPCFRRRRVSSLLRVRRVSVASLGVALRRVACFVSVACPFVGVASLASRRLASRSSRASRLWVCVAFRPCVRDFRFRLRFGATLATQYSAAIPGDMFVRKARSCATVLFQRALLSLHRNLLNFKNHCIRKCNGRNLRRACDSSSHHEPWEPLECLLARRCYHNGCCEKCG